MAAALASAGFGEMVAGDDGGFCTAYAKSLDDMVPAASARSRQLDAVCDARLDGRAALKESLGDLDSDASDGDLILSAIDRWGDDAAFRLIGDFAIACFDHRRGTLYCARDHIGARPFYYTSGAGWFAFASDPIALFALGDTDRSLDDRFILTKLSSRRFRSADGTFHQAIRKLPPGCYLNANSSGVIVRKYWEPCAVPELRLGSAQAYASRLRALIELAVSDRLRGVSKLGVHISGGLDSSAVAALAVTAMRQRGDEPFGFAWHRLDPGAPPASEPGRSEAVRAALGIELVAPLPRADGIAELIRRDWTVEPDPGNLMHELFVQQEAARRGVDVILSGWGGDQGASFEGRGYFNELFASGRWIKLWRELRHKGGRRSVQFARTAYAVLRERFRREDRVATGLASAGLRQRAQPYRVPIVRKSSARRTLRDLIELGAITSRLETWAASGARHGIEYRYPLLDRRILDFCHAIPTELFLQNGKPRWLMHAAVDDLLPEPVARYPSKHDPIRVEDLAPQLLEALAMLRPEVSARRDSFARAEYVDIDALLARMDTLQHDHHGQAPVRLALQLLDFPEPADKDIPGDGSRRLEGAEGLV